MKELVLIAIRKLKDVAKGGKEYNEMFVTERSLRTSAGKFRIRIYLEGGMENYGDNYFNAGADLSQINRRLVLIYLRIRILGRDPNDIDFWSKVETTLLHELIHAVDPKNLIKEVRHSIPEYYQMQKDPSGNFSDEEYFKYISHPNEVSAFEGSIYYYLLASARNGIPLKDAVNKFLQGLEIGDPGSDYLRHMRRDKVRWRKYMERIYKAAEQAYSDYEKEGRKTQKVF
jgi:hypothetical protein